MKRHWKRKQDVLLAISKRSVQENSMTHHVKQVALPMTRNSKNLRKWKHQDWTKEKLKALNHIVKLPRKKEPNYCFWWQSSSWAVDKRHTSCKFRIITLRLFVARFGGASFYGNREEYLVLTQIEINLKFAKESHVDLNVWTLLILSQRKFKIT